MSDHDVPDPDDVSLARALTRVRVMTARLSDVESELAGVRRSYEWALKGVAELQAILDGIRALPRYSDLEFDDAIEWAEIEKVIREVRGTGTPTGTEGLREPHMDAILDHLSGTPTGEGK